MTRRQWAEVLVQRLEQQGLTKDQLAAQCNVSSPLVWKWLNARGLPGRETSWHALQAALPDLPEPPWSAPATEPDPDGEVEAHRDELLERVRELEAENRRLSELATVDPLTGVLNSRAFDAAQLIKIEAAYRRGEPLAVLAFDIDHFKRLNTQYGHPAADEVLKVFAGAMAGSVRSCDVFARVGGEEFLAVLEGVNLQRARVLAERMRARCVEINVEGIRCTVSIGVSAHNAPKRALRDGEAEQLAKQLRERADKALNWAKEDGRDRVEVFDPQREAARKKLATAGTAPKRPRWTLGRLGLAASAVSLLLVSASFGGEGRGCLTGGPPPPPLPPPGCGPNGADCEDR